MCLTVTLTQIMCVISHCSSYMAVLANLLLFSFMLSCCAVPNQTNQLAEQLAAAVAGEHSGDFNT